MRLASFVRFALAAATLAASSLAVAAFPEKPIRVVIGFPAGGPLDQHARLLSDRLSAVLGQPILIDYKSGQTPTENQQKIYEKQLLLAAAMAERGGFPDLGPSEVALISYVGLGAGERVVETALTPELIAEGLAREFVSRVQAQRKAAGLDVADRIRLSHEVTDPALAAALETHRAYICAETLAVDFAFGCPAGSAVVPAEINGIACPFALAKS